MKHESSFRFLSFYTKGMVLAVMSLILVGALVTSHDAGLAVPDWPTTFGQNMFLYPLSQWRGGVFYEHGHRVFASMIGFLTVILYILIYKFEKRTWLRRLGLFALFAVILQGTLGGLTVILRLPALVSSCHAILAQTFFVTIVGIAYSYSSLNSRVEVAREYKFSPSYFYTILSFTGLVYIQLIVAAYMRHSGSGLAVLDFPSMGGSYLPDFSDAWFQSINSKRAEISLSAVSPLQVAFHLGHRFLAMIIGIFSLLILFRGIKDIELLKTYKKFSITVFIIVILQICLGISALLLKREPFITSLHVMLGAILLGVSVVFTLSIYSRKGN